MHWKSYTVSAIVECLCLEDEIKVSKQSVRQFLKWYKEYGTIARKPGSGLVSQLSPAIQRIIEQAMEDDDETSATQLQAKLADYGVYVCVFGYDSMKQALVRMDLPWISILSIDSLCKQGKKG